LRKRDLDWQPEHITYLHEERLDTVIRTLLASHSESVLDLGCGPGQLLVRLAAEKQFCKIVGIDQSQAALAEARALLSLPQNAHDENRLSLYHASFTSSFEDMAEFDAAVMVETIEHVAPRLLSAVEQAVFEGLRPKTVIITTPNREYNVLHGLADGVFRHPEHRFEWTRAKFRSWAEGVARRNGYRVEFEDIGERDLRHGSSTQMAIFSHAPN
jgi:small RNA 2'-O-methyltransferase